MARIKIEDVREAVEKEGWKVLSDTYENLETEMKFECTEGHTIYAPWKKLRNKIECPICKQNIYKNTETKVVSKKKGEKRILLGMRQKIMNSNEKQRKLQGFS